MSEIIKHKGFEVKIGTCENLYYTTFQEFAKRYQAGEFTKLSGNDEPLNYMAGAYRFRFPFPDEDHVKLFGSYNDYDRGVVFTIPKSEGIEIGHGKFFRRTDEQVKNAPAVGYYTPCVQSDEFKNEKNDWSDTARYTIFEIVQQKPVNGQLQVVVRCPYCGEMCRLSQPEVKVLVSYVWGNRDKFTPLQVKIAVMAAKGYKQAKLIPA